MIGIRDYRHAESLYVGKETEPEAEEEQELTPGYLAEYFAEANYSKVCDMFSIAYEQGRAGTKNKCNIYIHICDPRTGYSKGIKESYHSYDDDFEKNVRDLIERIETGEFK